MQSKTVHDLRGGAADACDGHSADAELALLRDVLRMLPAGVTVQDEYGRLVLVNDAAAAQLGISENTAAPASQQLSLRREAALELLRAGQIAVTEESVGAGHARRVLLTTHRPVRIAERHLLISSSADISEQKAFEDQLFRSAYYDELTNLPSRRLIEHRANKLLQREPQEKFALAFLDIDNFKHINDYYGHAIGDANRAVGREQNPLGRSGADGFLGYGDFAGAEQLKRGFAAFTLVL